MNLMMKSYELEKNASSEELESQTNAEVSENDEAVALGTHNETVEIVTDMVVVEEEPISDKIPGPEIPENSGNKISSEPEDQSVSQIFQPVTRRGAIRII